MVSRFVDVDEGCYITLRAGADRGPSRLADLALQVSQLVSDFSNSLP
jgi:hypothetical protein